MGLSSSEKPFLTPDTQNFIDTLEARGDPPLSSLTPEEARKVLADAQANPHDMPAADITDIELPPHLVWKSPKAIKYQDPLP